ncbi:hypothetical protein Syun_005375 [Stephania yunnanensis]|uniref:Uncharacterized protein n=1 Tax=Stephania yunnanensis TaxID=152371 RepID=A0AAP0L4N6_9MAGN
MESLCKLVFAVLLLLVAGLVDETKADGMISGTVYCDRCKDGSLSLFDYPLNGMKVTIACQDNTGQVTTWTEVTTNWFGSYTVRFDGNPDLSRCQAQLSSGNGQGSTADCGAVAGPPQQLRLMFRMFDMEMYTVNSLLSQPAKPMSYCSTSSPSPRPKPAPLVPSPPPPSARPPSAPFLEASACPSQNWTMPEYACHWRFVQPDTKVAVAFGLIAARRYGTDMSLREALEGRGDVYRALLREGTAALLNSYNSVMFGYPTANVVYDMNLALMGSQRQALYTAMRFRRSNSGHGTIPCKLNPCN